MDPHDGDGPTGLSRRAYLKLAGATAGVAGAGGFAALEADRQANPLRDLQARTTYYSGPESDRPTDVPPGTRFFAFDSGAEYVSTRAGWRAADVAAPRVRADAIDGVATRVVRTTAGLQRAFRSLERGDVVRIAGGVYRPDDWLDVGVSDVTVLGASRRETLIKPADGANVGGIRIGHGRAVENVHVAGVGFHGNEAAMDPSVKRCHGFLIDRGRNVTVRDCFATRTHPYHEHDRGGSGFTVRRHARDVAILDSYTDDVGDRSIQVAGTGVTVRGNRLTNGFDRAISLDVRHPDGRKYYARNAAIVNNLGRDNSTGSIVGASQGTPQRPGAGNYAIVGNVAAGAHRRTVYLGIEEAVRNVAIVGNSGRQDEFDEERSGIYVAGNVSSFLVAGNSLAGYSNHGIEIAGTGAGFVCSGNSVHDAAGDGIHVDTPEGTVANNVVEGAGGDGIAVLSGNVVVSGNVVRDAGRHGVTLGPSAPSVVTSNGIARFGVDDRAADGIHVDAAGSIVAANQVAGGTRGGFAVREGAPADANLYVANRLGPGTDADGTTRRRPGASGDAWSLSGPHSRTVGNIPAPDGRRTVDPSAGTTVGGSGDASVDVSFDRAYARKPMLDVQTDAAALWEADWQTDRAGNYTGVTLSFVGTDGSPVDATAEVRVADRP